MKRCCAVIGCAIFCLLAMHCKPAVSPQDATARRGAPQINKPAAPRPVTNIAASLLAPREAGPPRHEEERAILAARKEAKEIARSLLGGGISRREVASIADMRGYRHYRKRRYGQALAWFQRATQTDPSFELSAFNAARCAALLGRGAEALPLLRRLRTMDTSLSRALLQQVDRDPDLATVVPLLRPSL